MKATQDKLKKIWDQLPEVSELPGMNLLTTMSDVENETKVIYYLKDGIGARIDFYKEYDFETDQTEYCISQIWDGFDVLPEEKVIEVLREFAGPRTF